VQVNCGKKYREWEISNKNNDNIRNLYKRQLALPLIGNDKTYADYCKFEFTLGKSVDKQGF